MKTIIPALNYHLWRPCNMRCRFCFATFKDSADILPKGHLPKIESLQLVRMLAQSGHFQKITFAGGEPMLCPWVDELIKEAHQHGLKTMVVTNGSQISGAWLKSMTGYLDWIVLSIDSLQANTNAKAGRKAVGSRPPGEKDYHHLVELIKNTPIKLKINTVVHAWNFDEDFNAFIRLAKPLRWKILQALPMEGQNSHHKGEFEVTDNEFSGFVHRHAQAKKHTEVIPEDNKAMRGSYLMIDPAGRFFDNTRGVYRYTNPILKVGIDVALNDLNISYQDFLSRDGLYDY